MKHFIRIFLVLIPALTSCEDFFRTAVKVDPPSYVRGMVVNLYINDSDTTLWAMVSRNTGSLETVKDRQDLLLPDAVVTLLDEKGDVVLVMDTVTPADSEVPVNFVYHQDTAFGSNGHRFILQVTHPDYGMATAVQTMPHKPEVTHPLFNPEGGYDDYNGYYGLLSFDIKDPSGEENYYLIRVFVIVPELGYAYFAGITSDDPLVEVSYDWDALLIKDRTFDGENYPVKLKVAGINYEGEGGIPDNIRVYLDISAVTKDYYLYDRSLEKAMEASDLGFFVEPVQVYDNVQNGFGIFTLSARRKILAGRE